MKPFLNRYLTTTGTAFVAIALTMSSAPIATWASWSSTEVVPVTIPSSTSSSNAESGPGFGLTAPSQSGPGTSGSSLSIYVPEQEVGPGIPNQNITDVPLLPPVPIENDFLNNSIIDPVVKVTDRYSYELMEADIYALQRIYGDKVHINIIGQSHDGRSIYEVIVGNLAAPKHVLFQGAIHGREYMTPLLMMNQLEVALANYDTGHYDNMALSDMFQQVALHFVPMSNPDGVAISQFGLSAVRTDFVRQSVLSSYANDVAEGKTVLPLEQYLPYWKSNGAGVDLNHNFPAYWENISTPTAISYANYKGTSPFSEPESQALATLSTQRTWAATVSYHSMGNIIYWDTENNQAAESSKALAESVSLVTGYQLNHSKGAGGYKDWVQTSNQYAPSITLEVGSVACPMPVSEYDTIWQHNKSVWARVMSYVIHH